MMPVTVLYVEDEENDAFFVRRAFQKLDLAVALEWVSDGRKAITYLAGDDPYSDRSLHPLPGAVLLDLNLGSISGFEVLEWLRAQPNFASLPVVIFSSSNNPIDKEKALRLGANDYILKPASGVDFVEAMAAFQQQWLGSAHDMPGATARPSTQEPLANAPWLL